MPTMVRVWSSMLPLYSATRMVVGEIYMGV
jgi:hypothetical protein